MAFKDLYEYAKKQGASTQALKQIDDDARRLTGLGVTDRVVPAASVVPSVTIPQPTATPTVKQPEAVAPTTEEKEAPSKKDAAKTTMEQAAKAYDDYIKSDEHKQRMQEAENKARLDAAAQATFDPNFDIMTPQMIRDEKAELLRAARDQAEEDYNRSLDEEVMAADQAAIADLTDEERSMLEQYAVNRIGDQNRTLEMQGIMPTAQQQAAALIQKYGQQRVDELAESFMRQQNADLNKTVEEQSRQFANEHGVLGSLATIPVSAVGGLVGTAGHLQGMARNTGRYRTLDANETGTLGDVFTGAVRGQVQQNIEGEDPNLLRKAASVGYQGIMSMADSIARGYMGGGPIGAGVLAATSTFSQVMSEASRNGATPAQAAALATVNSAIEAVTEAIPLDELIKTAKGQGAGTVLKNVLRNAGIEATAEELSLVGTFLAEAAIMQEQSGYQQEVRDLILGGMSPEAARETANRNLLNEAANTLFVSGLSGGLSSVGASVADAKSIPTPPTLEQVADMMLGDLVKPKQEVQNQTNPMAQQGEGVTPETTVQTPQTQPAQAPQDGENAGNDVLMRTMELMVNNDGKFSNKAAENILRDQDKLRFIMEQTAADITGTKSEQRAKLKAAMEQMFQNQNTEANTQTATEAQAQAPQASQQPEAVQPQVQTPQQQTPVQTPAMAQEGSAPQADMQMGANNQSTVNGQIKGTGAAERNFSGVAAYEDMLAEGNIQKPHSNPAREVEMPKADSDGRRVTEFADNVANARVTPDPVADAVKSLVGDKQLSFDTRTNQQSLNNAAEDIRTRGADTVRTEIAQNAANGVVKDGDIERGLVLYAEYANDPQKQDAASGLIVDMAKLANMSGRNLQLFSLMQRMTPEGQLMTVKKNVGRYIEDINKGRSKRKQIQNSDTLVDENLAKAFTDAKTEKEKAAALDEIYKDIASKIKPTIGEMYDAWRNLAMLGNVKTHERNIFSTAAFQPYVEVKRAIGAALEKAADVEKDKRTKAGLVGKEAKDLLKWAKQDAKSDSVMGLMKFSGTTGNEARSAIQDHRKILPGVLDKAAKKNMEIMEKSDMFFKKNEYARSLASFLKARGYTADDLQNGTVPRGVLDEGRQYAVKEAQKATFNDSNKFSDAVVKLGKPNNRDGWAVMNVVKKGMLPYLRTPANVVARAAEYNPLAGVKTLATAKQDIESGRKSTAEVLDQLSASLTGTAATGLGMLLGAGMVPGVELVGAIEDEEELRKDAQEYSLKIGDTYYGVGWLAPAMIPLFLGANLVRNGAMKTDENADVWDLALAVVNLGVDTIEPILDLSMLSSLNDTIDKFANEDDPGDKVMAALLNTATSYLQQGLPTIFGHLEQATEAEKSATFVNTDNKLEKAVKTTIANATKRIPLVDLYQTTKLDEFGEPVKNESNPLKRAMNAVFNPFTETKEKDDPLTKEIVRLNREGYNVSPRTAPKVISYQDENGAVHKNYNLSAEEYQTFSQVQGETAKKILDEIYRNPSYASLTDEQKNEVWEKAFEYAEEEAKKEALPSDYSSEAPSWMASVKGSPVDEIINKAVMSSMTKAFKNGGNPEAMEAAYNAYKGLPPDQRQQFQKEATGKVKHYLAAKESGMSEEKYLTLYDNYERLEGDKSLDNGQKAVEWAHYLNKAVKRGEITQEQKEVMIGALNFWYNTKATAGKYDTMVSEGIDPDTAYMISKTLDDVIGTGANGTVRDIDTREAIAKSGLPEAEIDAVMKAYMPDYDPNAKSKQYTELKYDYLRQEVGLTPQEYTAVCRVYQECDQAYRKTVSALTSKGYDTNTAREIYNVLDNNKKYVNLEEWYRSILQ